MSPHALLFNIHMNAVVSLIFMLFSLNSLIDDITIFRLRIREIIVGTIVAIAVQAILGKNDWTDTLAGAIIGYVSFIAIRKLTHDRLGAGDVWYSGFIGTCFGFWVWDFAMLIGTFIGFCYILYRRLKNKDLPIGDIRIPFLPCMFAGVLIVFVYRKIAA